MKKQVLNRRINFLRKVLSVQQTYQEHYVEGLPTTVIHRKHIEPTYHISVQTLREYLAIPAKRELDSLTTP